MVGTGCSGDGDGGGGGEGWGWRGVGWVMHFEYVSLNMI